MGTVGVPPGCRSLVASLIAGLSQSTQLVRAWFRVLGAIGVPGMETDESKPSRESILPGRTELASEPMMHGAT